ncbi:MAG TPA: nucleotide exchange factor GrpE [Candidatus Paceibacterota bacterium]|nr:nucleotide exchange factor GrpE [Candidatus Paceibacterota bacterium]
MKGTPHEHEDIDFEPEDELGDVGALKAKLKKLRDELAKVKEERQEYLDGWQRCKADAVNARQEMLRQAQRQGERLLENFIDDLIPALDGFDMAAGSPAWESVAPEWRSGIDQIRNQLLDVLARNGFERFGKRGEKFDHRLHEAVQEMDDAPGESGEIVRILRYGYKKGDQVIRPAQVIVKK